MALVTLVVVGHAWTLLPDTRLNTHLYDFLYAWHVPAFVFVTGYLSQRFHWTPQRLWALVKTVAVPYVVFEAALAIFRVKVGGEELEDLFTDPHWPMWYLSALFFWRLLTPIFRPLPGAVVVAIGLSLAAGLWAGDTFDVARIMGLLPFFVMGLKATPERLALLRQRRVKQAGVAILVALAVVSLSIDSWASTEWLYYRSTYGQMGSSDLEAIGIRTAMLTMGTLGAFSFLSLVPRVHGWFTRMGAWTLVVYLFHGFAIKGAAYAGYSDWADDHAIVSFVLTSLLAVLLALGLALTPVARRLNAAVDPVGTAERKVKATLAPDDEDEDKDGSKGEGEDGDGDDDGVGTRRASGEPVRLG